MRVNLHFQECVSDLDTQLQGSIVVDDDVLLRTLLKHPNLQITCKVLVEDNTLNFERSDIGHDDGSSKS